MKKLVTILFLVLCLGLSLAGCQGEKPEPEPTEDIPELKVAMLSTISQGTPFATLEWSGLSQAADNGFTDVKFVECLDSAEYEEQIRAFAEDGYGLIFSQFDALNAYVLDLAEEYPDTFFYLCDSGLDVTGHENVGNLLVDPTEGAFVAGYVAAFTSESGIIGWVGSLDQANINRYRYGFEAGVAYYNEENGTDVKVLTGYTGSNTDSEKAAEIATSFIEQGADLIAEVANLGGLGALQVAAEKGVKAMGCDSYMSDDYEAVFWNPLKDIDMTLLNVCKEFASGKTVPGVRYFTLATGARAFDTRDYDRLSAEDKALVDAVVNKLVDGTIEVADAAAKAEAARAD